MDIESFISLIEDGDVPSPGPDAVARFEAENGLALPEDYRAFLAVTPGGRVRGNVHFSLVGEDEGPEIMGSVLGLQSEGYNSLARRLADAEKDSIPHGLLPVMRDRGGNTIALVLRPDRLGEMVFLDHEVADEGRATLEAAEADDWAYALTFAGSFTAMIAGFKLVNN
ncbi:SMI1/KNR4 family protein [Dyella flagellata]|uniref:SMI1/KNR4 family protein n=2 Tax=Dyella flagellata TaxID=1867833 RepID=A0ABQ5X6L6_9GAMM|nr:SMI1/KNR4 family protein [Dyella flagellata]